MKGKKNLSNETEIRATFIVDKSLLEQMKAIAYWDRKLIKDVLNTSLIDTIAKYITEKGEIKPVPEE